MTEWISVEDRLPEKECEVLVFTKCNGKQHNNYTVRKSCEKYKNRRFISDAVLNCHHTKIQICQVGITCTEITHWAELPEPPS